MHAARQTMDRLITDRVILVVGWLWFLVYAYPGYMSYDSVYQLSQARHLEPINEWHPPVMALIWRLTDAVIAGPFPMLVIQSVLFLVGTYSLLRRVMSPRAAAIVAAVLLVAPQNIVVMAVIWKDSQMAGFLVASLAALLSQKRGWRITGYVLLCLATAVRYNAAAAAFPIVLAQFGWQGRWTGWRRYALATVAWIGLAVVAFFVDSLLVETKVHPWETAGAPVDIAGIIRFSPHLDNDQLLRDTPGVPWAYRDKIQIRARTWYHPENQFLTLTSEGPARLFDYPTTDEQRAGLSAAWKKLLLAHPTAYARHRIALFSAQLACQSGGAGGVFSDFTNPVYDHLLDHRAVHSALQQTWIHAMEWFDDTLMYRVGLYFLISLVLLPFCRRDRLAFVLLVSGIFHELGLLLVAPAIDYRYSQWMIACALLGAVVVFTNRFRARAGRQSAP